MELNLERLQAVLLPEAVSSEFVNEDGAKPETPLTPASVLFPIVLRDEGFTVLLTQRTAHLKDHPGQISFPGGRAEASDVSPVHTALRETQEEIGLAAQHISPLGFLPEYRTGTGYRVTPVVATVTPPFATQADPFEVAEIFEVPLSFLMNPANHQRHSLHVRGAMRHFHAMPYGSRFIWGATAGMIFSLYQRLVTGLPQ